MLNIEKIKRELEGLQKESSSPEEDARLLELHKTYSGSDQIISAKDFLKLYEETEVLYKAGSGLTELDKIVEGFRPGTLIIISGPTKQGKTTLCQTLTNNFTEQKYQCLWFSFDTPPGELIGRFKKLPVFFLPKRNEPEKKMDWIELRIIEGIAKYNTRMIFIDHLGFLSRYTDRAQNYATELTSIVRELKEISIRWGVTIFLNHHIRGIDAEITPNYGHLKDSSGPAQDSDITIMVWRERKKADYGVDFTNNSYISVQLHRRTGKTGTFKVHFEENTLIDAAPESEEMEF